MRLLYNIDFEVASAFFLATLYLYVWLQCSRQSEVILMFRRLVLIALLADLLDVASAIALSYTNLVPREALMAINTIYLLMVGQLGLWFDHYAYLYVHRVMDPKSSLGIHRAIFCFFVVLLVVNVFTEFIFGIDDTGAYVHGKAYMLVYVVPYYFFLVGIWEMLRDLGWSDAKHKVSVLIYLLGGFVGSFLQIFYFSHVLLALTTPTFGLLLIFFQIHSDELKWMPVEYEVPVLVESCCRNVKSRAEEKDIGIRVINDPKIPAVLFGDAARIQQLLIRILNKVISATDHGFVVIGLSMEDLGDDHIILRATVEGQKEDRDFAVDDGMLQLLELMKGTVRVEHRGKEQSAVILEMLQTVIVKRDIGRLYANGVYPLKKKMACSCMLSGNGAKILAVDDMPINQEILRSLLEGSQIEIENAYSGKEFLDKIEAERYDIILLDDLMPSMSGVEALQKMKEKRTLNQDTPVIALTANIDVGARKRYMGEGFSDYLAKPIFEEDLWNMLHRFLPQNKIQPTGMRN